MEFKQIKLEDIPAMAELLIERQRVESEAFPFLKNNCLHVEYITNLFEKWFNHHNMLGVGAFINHELVGYIIGEIKHDTTRGRHVWVHYEGVAIRQDESSELIRQLYAKASAVWVAQGCFTHYTLIPLGNKAYYDAYQRLSFAIQQAHAVMEMADYQPFDNVAEVDVRFANEMDSEALGQMSSIIQAYQNAAPTFEPVLPETAAEIKIGYSSVLEEEDAICLLATKDKNELAFQVYFPANSNLMTPDNAIELSIAGTYDVQMGKGVGKKLMNESYRIMQEKGYQHMVTDWRITNLASSTFWPKCGFKPVAYRMVRHIDRDIAWGNFRGVED
ncbi:GNAT family N-acetyltransferase [Metasolibacillus sp.]|uniref:GNAT family N-acetyltransferase n=1 Tax=Metasolibacillus sp. TaxID=2703680 RepID=UPI0025EE3C8C|nr:GNAT family N-acetyltransferase [Metasolibacillus sp.]MCT6924567.1 GNAT family N-acetyltransferase [Metasolibacillus sp.]MCT6940719.1 GNAT family N-acetyltransferase [Metasolibacillus sp.]